MPLRSILPAIAAGLLLLPTGSRAHAQGTQRAAQAPRAAQRPLSARAVAYRDAKKKLLAKGKGFVRSSRARWVPVQRAKGVRATGGMRMRTLRKARVINVYIPETQNGVLGFRVETLYGMAQGEAPVSPELGRDGARKVEAAYGTAVAAMVDQHITKPAARDLHEQALTDLETVEDAQDPIVTGRRGIEAVAAGRDRWTRYLPPLKASEYSQRSGRPATESVTTRFTPDGLAVVRLTGFTQGIADKIRSDLTRTGRLPRGILLDLRGNGGGITGESRKLLELFARDTRLMSQRLSRGGGKEVLDQWFAPGRGPLADIPLIVLVNDRSASASETVTSSLKDNGQARIAGRRTLGKGVGQTYNDLEDDGQIAVTYTQIEGPRSRYHGRGIDPDISEPALESRARRSGQRAALNGGRSAAVMDPLLVGALEELRDLAQGR